MKLHRRRGATLGLVAVCVFVIIVLGIGFFILSQILGGGREIANATDAGVLTVARHALSPANINVALASDSDSNPVFDFTGFDPSVTGTTSIGGKIDMLGINRVVAQSVIVALNAQQINTGQATNHANSVANAAKSVAKQLRTLLNNNSYLQGQFTNVASANNTKMFQGHKATLNGPIVSGFMKPGLSTNVYWPAALNSALPVSPPSNLKNKLSGALKHNNTDEYMAGYVNFAIPAGSGSVTIAGVPIFPQQKPHLVDFGEFNAASSGDPVSSNYLPPNAFRTDTQTQEDHSGGFGGAVACAIVGALDQDFQASIPRGYVRIQNGPAATAGNIANPVVDGSQDVFNNELWPPNGGGVNIAQNGVFALNSDGQAQSMMDQWATYNNSATTTTTSAPQPPAPPQTSTSTSTSTSTTTTTTGPTQPPLPSTSPSLYSNMKVITPNGYRNVTDADVLGITGITYDCDAIDGWDRRSAPTNNCWFPNDDGSSPGTGDVVHAIEAWTGANSSSGSVNTNNFTAVENQKAQLLTARGRGAKCMTVQPAGASGMKIFNVGGCYNTPASNVDFGQIGSPMDYLNQIGQGNSACKNSVLGLITKRMQQADPSISQGNVVAALSTSTTPLGMGETMYLYSPGPGAVKLATGSPADYFNPNLANDGKNSAAQVSCENTYNLTGTLVDSEKGHGNGPKCGKGDANYHDVPFTEKSPLQGADKATFTPATGWRNLLGDVTFENEAKDTGTFCKPN